jgi:CubicO group peptidase (beta-lactamase class C family)
MAVIKLVDEGKLSLTDSVGELLSDVPPHWNSLTIHQLLTHTSGLIHTWDVLEDSILMFQKENFKNTLNWYSNKPLQFESGSSFYYSGVGYLLLAAIIESVTHTTFDQHLKNVIFDPLNMNNTGASDPEVIIENMAKGYSIDSTGVHNAPSFYVPLLTGGGHLYSTVGDLLKWDRALNEYSILSKEVTGSMYTPIFENYGYGWNIVKNDSLNMVFHTGFIPGYLSRFDNYLDYDLTLIILTNYHADWSPIYSWDITNLIFDSLKWNNK